MRALATALALMLAPVTAAVAGNICRPDPGEGLRLVGVPQGDTLTVRAGPGPDYRKLGDLLPGQRDVRATGRVQVLGERCSRACADLLRGFTGGRLAEAIDRDCRRQGRIWYEVRTRRGPTGWSHGAFLAMAGPAVPPIGVPPKPPTGTRPPPPDPALFPNDDREYRFLCEGGQTIRFTQRAEPFGRAELAVGNGPGFILTRGKGALPIDHAGEGMAIRGDLAGVTWTGLDGRARGCRPA